MSQDIFDREALRQQPQYGGTNTPGSNGSGDIRSQTSPPPVPPVLLAILGSVVVLTIVLVVSLLISGGRSPAPDAVKAPAVQAPTAPAPVNTPVPTATAGETAIALVDQLLAKKQYKPAAYMAEEALKPTLPEHERNALQERAISAHLHALLAAPVDVLDVSAQQQVVNRYDNLAQQAAAAGVSFKTNLEGAELAKDAKKYLLSKLLFERGYGAGEYTKADHDILRLYREVLYKLGWHYAQGSDTLKAEGLRLLAASYALEKEQGITHGDAWAELVKYCGRKEADWPPPAETPLLPTTQNGGT